MQFSSKSCTVKKVTQPSLSSRLFCFRDTAPPGIYTLSLHDALPISRPTELRRCRRPHRGRALRRWDERSEEHTSELQSRFDLVCRLLREKTTRTNMLDHQHPHDQPGEPQTCYYRPAVGLRQVDPTTA